MKKFEEKVLDRTFWEALWKKAQRNSSVKINKLNYRKWSNFWDLMSECYEEIEKNSQDLVKKIIETLKEEKLISKKDEILEIGCGTGTFTVPLSYEVRKVVALDSSSKMLNKLKNKIETLKISNIELILKRWEDFASDKKFDFVFAAFCPAIRDGKTLLKMKELSKNYACLVRYAKPDDFTVAIRNKLWKFLTGREWNSQGFHIIYPFNLLYTYGFYPQLKLVKSFHIVERDIESLIRQYESYFKIFIPWNKEKSFMIRKFFEDKANKGKVVLRNYSEVYLMWW
ncbi:MAG: class I SAM-dependent methyltransferase [Candidatus Aenigmatarchaeota archaeon]